MLELDFEKSEYDARIAQAKERMGEHDLDALLLTTEGNIRYFTGYSSHRWLQPTSPQYVLLPRRGDPILVAAAIEMDRASEHPWLGDLRGFSRSDNGMSMLAQAVRDTGARRVGDETNSIFRMGMAFQEFRTLCAELPGVTFVDGAPVLWGVRVRKSEAEVALMERALAITDDSFQALRARAQPGNTEIELHAIMVSELMMRGAERPGSMPLGSRSPGTRNPADSHLRKQSSRKVMAGDVVWLDCGCVWGGYWSDTLRMFSIGEVSADWCDAYAFVHEAVHACIAQLQPGAPTSRPVELYQEMLGNSRYRDFYEARFQKGVVAHAIGMDLIEPPFLATGSTDIVEPGMVFTVEPFLYTSESGFFMIEEQVLVTESGPRILSREARAELPGTDADKRINLS